MWEVRAGEEGVAHVLLDLTSGLLHDFTSRFHEGFFCSCSHKCIREGLQRLKKMIA
jgi:hypothetical protein